MLKEQNRRRSGPIAAQKPRSEIVIRNTNVAVAHTIMFVLVGIPGLAVASIIAFNIARTGNSPRAGDEWLIFLGAIALGGMFLAIFLLTTLWISVGEEVCVRTILRRRLLAPADIRRIEIVNVSVRVQGILPVGGYKKLVIHVGRRFYEIKVTDEQAREISSALIRLKLKSQKNAAEKAG